MTEQSLSAWAKARALSDVPDGFADRVMGEVRAVDAGRRTTGLLAVLAGVASSRAARGGLIVLAGAAFALRIAFLLAVFAAA